VLPAPGDEAPGAGSGVALQPGRHSGADQDLTAACLRFDPCRRHASGGPGDKREGGEKPDQQRTARASQPARTASGASQPGRDRSQPASRDGDREPARQPERE
jgi:hypothetical protein